MGISKGRTSPSRRSCVGTVDGWSCSDGELHEGHHDRRPQQGAVGQAVAEITGLGNLVAKLSAFGWRVERGDGHESGPWTGYSPTSHRRRLCLLIADTIKGRRRCPLRLLDATPGACTSTTTTGAPESARLRDEVKRGSLVAQSRRWRKVPKSAKPDPGRSSWLTRLGARAMFDSLGRGGTVRVLDRARLEVRRDSTVQASADVMFHSTGFHRAPRRLR